MTISARFHFTFLFVSLAIFNTLVSAQGTGDTGAKINLSFINVVNDRPISLNDSPYVNPSGQVFTITKLKYYISNISLRGTNGKPAFNNTASFLINEAIDSSKIISLSVPPGDYSSISFFLGVDSFKNVSGAQTGALDPLNGMYWTWNSGYIMFKLEGKAAVSLLVNNQFEYHIGGYAGRQNAVQSIVLNFPEDHLLTVKNRNVADLKLEADINEIWKGQQVLDIISTPACNTPGALSVAIANNLSKMFKLIFPAR